MKISYNWLKEFADLNLAPRDLAERLTMAGLAVDAVEAHGADFVLEFDLTSNRPDCLSHLGVAREAAAVCGKPLTPPETKLNETGSATAAETSVQILAPELCPRYTARLIKGVKIGPSPDWLRERLEAFGQRSINNVADITNYVMLELGQPLHAFDFHKLAERRIVVRTARAGEKLKTLDGVERELTPEMLVIADAENAVALAGVMGGEDSEISAATTDVLLESAHFHPLSVRQTARTLGMNTEASYRFERWVDPELAARASDRAAALIAELAGGEVLAGVVDAYPGREALLGARQPIVFRRSRYRALTGLEIELGEAERILRALGMQVEADVEQDALRALAPTWRVDLALEEDLLEEVARISGYEKVQTTLPGSAGAGAYLAGEEGRRAVRRTLAALGYHEAVSFSFVKAETDALFSNVASAARLFLSNPIDVELSQMRTNLSGGLLNALARNFQHGTRNVRLFEIGKCFADVEGERPHEEERLALVATGARNESDWQAAAVRLDFYDVKGALESLIESVNLPALTFAPVAELDYLHPGRSALVSLDNRAVGFLGQLHPRLAAFYKFKQPVFVAELNFGALLAAARVETRYRPLPKYPAVVRDLALLVDSAVSFAALETAIAALGIPELVNVQLFDLYAGKELPAGKHSLAISFTYRAAERTLTETEVNAAHQRIVQALTSEFAAEVR